MLITSLIGLAFNIANLLVLKYASNEDEEEDKVELIELGTDATDAEKAKPRDGKLRRTPTSMPP